MKNGNAWILLALTVPAVLIAGRTLDAQTSSAGLPPVPVATAVRVDATIRLDGRLDETVWADAPVVSDFTQMDPSEGAPVSERTEVRIIYDDAALYIGARLHDRGAITARLGRRDMPLGDSDWFGVVLDSYHDRRTGFVFDVNPAGVQRDAVKSVGQGGDESDDNSWDGVWEVATSIDDDGWTAEYRIPFSQLRFRPGREQLWGIQLERVIGRNHEYAVFSFTPKSERGGIARYGLLEGLIEIRPGKRIEVLPYVVARGEYVDPGPNPYRADAEQHLSAGVDLTYRMTAGLTMNATINPDFGQVEVDPAVVNLGVYETFFEEKRPFFIEGSEIFDFGSGGGGQLFYTRRIGRAPQISPPTARSDLPDATTILGAAKLSGKAAGGWSIGIMEAATARESARFRDPADETREMTVEPLTNYFVARARREMRAGQSTVGGLVTAVHRDLETDPLRARLRSAAYTGGIDFRHEWANRSWVVRGSVAMSHVRGDPAAITAVQTASNHFFQRPDADHLSIDADATTLTGVAAQLSLGRQAGEHWRGELSLATTTPGYEVNDIGFNYRTDRRDVQLNGSYRENRPGAFLRNYSLSGRARFEYNTANQLIANWLTATAYLRHLNYWAVHLMASHSLRANDDRLTRGGPMATRPANTSAQVNLYSDSRKPVTIELEVAGERNEFDGWSGGVGAEIGLKVSPRWNLSVGPRLDRAHVVAQYVATFPDPTADATFGGRYVFAPLDQTTLSLETRFNLTFTPKLTLQLYAQPFLSSADYGAPRELAAPRSYAFLPYAGAVPDLDFNLRSLRGNAVLRWEWRPGSTLFLAWQQSRSDLETGTGDFDLGRDHRALLRAEPDNIFLLKVNYWLNP